MKDRSICFVLFLVVSLVSIAQTSLAEVIHVPGNQPTIQQGIDAALPGDTVLVADGVYTGAGNRDITFRGKSITVISENGFETTTIDCENAGRAFCFISRESRNAVLSGFSITRGSAFPDSENNRGGGVFCRETSPTIVNCRITNCNAVEGGGVYSEHGSPLLDSCRITHNVNAMVGGGVSFWGGSPWLANCTIDQNSVTSNGDSVFGGGLFLNDSNAKLTDCIIQNNTATDGTGSHAFGGGLFIQTNIYYQTILNNCLIIDNRAVHNEFGNGAYGGGLTCMDGFVLVNSCTFSMNQGGTNGGPIYAEANSNVQLQNCIIWDNNPAGVHGATRVTYSNIQGGYAGTGNIDTSPLFTSGPDGDYYLSQMASGQSQDSPCLNEASTSSSSGCYLRPSGEFCLINATTRTDLHGDDGELDMGFHYSMVPSYPTPTPMPTSTPVICQEPGVQLWMPSHVFFPGDPFVLKAHICNTGTSSLNSQQLMVILMVFDELFFFPSWGQTFDGLSMILEPGLTEIVIVELTLPDTLDRVNGMMFISYIMSQNTDTLFGDADFWNFSFQE